VPKPVNRLWSAISALRMQFLLESTSRRVAASTNPRALIVMGDGPGLSGIQEILSDAGWKLTVEHSTAAGISRQMEDPAPIILYDRELNDVDWRQAVVFLARLSPRPCLILMSQRVDRNIWDELVHCGGFDLLRVPVERQQVIQTTKAAWSIWQSQHPSHSEAGCGNPALRAVRK